MSKKEKKWTADDINNLTDLRNYIKAKGLKYLFGHSIWKQTGSVQENVEIICNVVYDKKYRLNALLWYLKGDRRRDANKINYVAEDNVSIEKDGRYIYLLLYQVGLRIRITII